MYIPLFKTKSQSGSEDKQNGRQAMINTAKYEEE